MPGKLSELIVASGFTAIPGRSFRNHVASASTGVSMKRYKAFGWTLSGAPNPATEYASGTSFTIGIQFTSQADYFQYIKRVGAVLVVTPWGGNPSGSSVNVTSNSVIAAETGSQLIVNMIGGVNPAAIFSGDAWFNGYSKPFTPPGGGPDDAVWQAYMTGASGGGGHSAVGFDLTYTPDAGGFNPATDYVANLSGEITYRAETIFDHEIEWYNDSAYTSLRATGQAFVEPMSQGDFKTFYLRQRPIGAGSWTNVGGVSMFDPR